jgi:hypothetical protein
MPASEQVKKVPGSSVAYLDPDPYVFGHPDPDPLVNGTDPAPDPDPSIIKQKY